jgi:hypothetical protein
VGINKESKIACELIAKKLLALFIFEYCFGVTAQVDLGAQASCLQDRAAI